jgi:hypothetical protein
MLGKWGKVEHNSLAHRGLFASPHFSQYKRCWGSGGSGVGEWGSGVGVLRAGWLPTDWGVPDRLGGGREAGTGFQLAARAHMAKGGEG